MEQFVIVVIMELTSNPLGAHDEKVAKLCLATGKGKAIHPQGTHSSAHLDVCVYHSQTIWMP